MQILDSSKSGALDKIETLSVRVKTAIFSGIRSWGEGSWITHHRKQQPAQSLQAV
jgi:hypothetical protein